ncbi:MAG: PepSY-like domain-containing protein [Tannerella sp.]|jgi:hypothetical protein|nr:PepSY-like domain-containing protein [Tannerella sp.]
MKPVLTKIVVACGSVVLSCGIFFFLRCDESIVSGLVPDEDVLHAFDLKYPDADDIVWTLEKNYYVADFSRKAMRVQAWFDMQGDWSQSREEMDGEQLHRLVANAFSAGKYAARPVESVSLLERKDLAAIYLIHLSGDENVNLYYSAFGDLIKVRYHVTEYMEMPVLVSPEISAGIDRLFDNAVMVDLWINSYGIQACIRDNGQYKIIAFDDDYEWLASIWEIDERSVPEVILNGFKASKYGRMAVDRYRILVNYDSVSYLIYFREGDTDKIMKLTDTGTPLYVISFD